MQELNLTTKIDRKSSQVLLKAIASFPEFLARSEPETAAKIVADLIKTQMNRPVEEEEPGDKLAAVIARARAEVALKEPKP